jgi:uracil phosphoribosyltransferase
MLNDSQYLHHKFRISEMDHKYGPNIHVLDDVYLFTTLARLCSPDCKQPAINQLLNILYRELVKCVVNQEFPRVLLPQTTRMKGSHPEGEFQAEVLDPSTKVVCVNLARAGTVPSQICFDAFNYILNPDGIRQDHISINRKLDATEKVIGTNLGGVKIGGGIDDSFVVVPDPMGATGSTILTAMEVYAPRGKAKKFIAAHLIITPEYLRAVTKKYPEVIVYAIRLDRGLSPSDVLSSMPGTHWDRERGLNQKQYVVPGAGGLGEVINNSYV